MFKNKLILNKETLKLLSAKDSNDVHGGMKDMTMSKCNDDGGCKTYEANHCFSMPGYTGC